MKKTLTILGIASLVLSIVADITTSSGEIMLFYTAVPLIFGIAGLALSVVGIILAAKNNFPKQMFTIGIILSAGSLAYYFFILASVNAALEAM